MSQGLVDTALFQFNALTGETVLEHGIQAEVLHGRDVVNGPIVDSFFLDAEDTKIVMLLDEFLQRFFCIVLFFVQCDAGFLESLDTRTEGRKVRIKALVSCNVLNPMA